MKVLKQPDNIQQESETVKLICDYCHAELEISRDDCQIGWNGWCYCECPCCGDTVYPEIWDVKLTENNIEYPLHFTNAERQVQVEDERIQNAIRKGAAILKNDPDCSSWFMDSGDTLITMFRLDDDEEILIFVSKKPQECYLSYEYWS